MARAAVKAKQAERAKAQPPQKQQRGRRGHASGGNPNQNLFFMRLRRRQRWVFLGLAVVFAVTFAAVGVGSGSGSGLDQLYAGIFGGSGDAVSKASAEIKTNPAKGYQDLANAYIAKNDIASAVIALQLYLKGQGKNDASLWSMLGGLEKQQGDTYAQDWQAASQAAALASPSSTLAPSGTLGQQLTPNPLDQFYSQQTSTQVSTFYQQATSSYATALSAYQTAAKLQPRNAQAQFAVYTIASGIGQSSVAIKALQHFVAIDPKSPQVPAAEQACQKLGGVCTPAYVKAIQQRLKHKK